MTNAIATRPISCRCHANVGGGGAGLVTVHGRKPTAAQVTAATQLYFARDGAA
jgi:hypothetical protein